MSIQKKSTSAIAMGVVLLASSGYSAAATLFADDFQTNQFSTLWAGTNYPCSSGTHAYIAPDPLVSGGNALAFRTGNCWSDIVTTNKFSSSTGTFTISFDYMHIGQGNGFGTGGGFLGWGDGTNFGAWLQMDSPSYGQTQPSNQWTHISTSFASSSPINLFIEQWNGQSNTAGTALYKNLLLTDGNGPTPTITVPEPASLALLGVGLAGLGAVRRKQKAA